MGHFVEPSKRMAQNSIENIHPQLDQEQNKKSIGTAHGQRSSIQRSKPVCSIHFFPSDAVESSTNLQIPPVTFFVSFVIPKSVNPEVELIA